MTSITKRISPELDIDELDLNISRGRSSKLWYYSGAPQETFYWSKNSRNIEEYSILAREIVARISSIYFDVYHGCFIKNLFYIKIDNNSISKAYWKSNDIIQGAGTPLTQDKVSALENKLARFCIPNSENKEDISDLVAIPIGIKKTRNGHFLSGHLNILIINNVAGTLELYDPNGFVSHRKHYRNIVESFLSKNFFIEGYKFLPIEENNPDYSLQALRSGPYTESVCVLWCLYIAELRAKYIHQFTTAGQFRRALQKRIYKILAYIQKTTKDNEEQFDLLGEYLSSYLLEFIAQVDTRDELSPATPVEFEYIEDYFTESPRRVISPFIFPQIIESYFTVSSPKRRQKRSAASKSIQRSQSVQTRNKRRIKKS